MASLVFRLCDNAPEILRDVCLERGWKEYEEDEDEDGAWNLWWKSSGFRTSDFESCRPWQRLNHFPKSNSITRKDSLARNLRRMKGVYGSILFNFVPLSFNLPNDYRKFVTEYSKDKNKRRLLWICKPADQSRGKGIFLFRNLTDLTYDCATVVQEYIQNPFLIAGYKFDLRLYVLVTSFHPLHIYFYHEGLARFGTEKFDLNSLDNVYSHLTNTSINKQSPFYATDKERIGSGCKWSLGQLRTYFYQHNVNDQLLWQRITAIVVLTLLMQAPEVQKDTNNCFELFGFDILIDANLKPWLLEVNFSPSLGIDCSLDITIKKALLEDTLKAINLKEIDSSSCNLKGCITKIGTCFSNKRSLSRTISKISSYSNKSRVNTSSRFYTRSRLSKTSHSLVSRISKESSENENPECSSYTEENLSISVTNNNIEKEESLSSCDNLADLSSPSCSTAQETIECNEHENSNSEVKEAQEHCYECSQQKTCKLHGRPESSLSQTNASLEFRKAFSYTRTPRVSSSSSQTCKLATLKTDSSSSSDAMPECTLNEELNSYPKCTATCTIDLDSASQMKFTKLPPLKRSIKKATSFPFVKRSPKIVPYLPVKRREIPTKPTNKSQMSCSCDHASQRWGAYKMNPAKQIGDYILVFPFNDATQKACTSKQFNSKAAIDEVKKVIQKITYLEKNKSKFETSDDEREKLDLNKPFIGFSSLFNWPS